MPLEFDSVSTVGFGIVEGRVRARESFFEGLVGEEKTTAEACRKLDFSSLVFNTECFDTDAKSFANILRVFLGHVMQ